MNVPLRLLIVEESEKDAASIVEELQHAGYDPTFERIHTLEALRAALAQQTYDIVIADDSILQLNGLAMLRLLQENELDLPLLMVSDNPRENKTHKTIAAGGHDYVHRDDLHRLGPAVRRELREAGIRRAHRQTEERFRSIVESIPMGVHMYQLGPDDQLILAGANPAADEILGIDNSRLVGRTIEEAFPTLVETEIPQRYREAAAEGQSWRTEQILYEEDQIQRAFEIHAFQTSPGRMVAAFHDITERKQAEEALYASLEQAAHGKSLLLVLSQAAQAIQRAPTADQIYRSIGDQLARLGCSAVVLTLSEDRTCLEVAHTTFNSLAFLPTEQFSSISPQDYSLPVTPGDIYDQILSSRQAVFFSRPSTPMIDALPPILQLPAEKIVSSLDLEYSICAPLAVGGQAVGLLIIAGSRLTEDDLPAVTAFANQAAIAIENIRLYADLQQQMEQLKSAQFQLVQSAKLAAVGELAAGVAHELNNPLTSVLGFAEMLLEETQPDSPFRDDLETIAAEARRARSIVRNLLDFARQTKPLRQPGDVNQILQQTLAVIRYHLEKGSIRIEEDYAPDLGFIPVDEGQLKQVFLNLVTNAVRAMPEGGTLYLRTFQAGENVAISFADTGAGIPLEIQDRIFDPFFTTNPEGTGLGLSVSLGIVQEHGGRIIVDSQPGQGSTFTIWLPREPMTAESDEQ